MSISGQKYAEIGIELSQANVLDNYSFYFKSLAKKKELQSFSKHNIYNVT